MYLTPSPKDSSRLRGKTTSFPLMSPFCVVRQYPPWLCALTTLLPFLKALYCLFLLVWFTQTGLGRCSLWRPTGSSQAKWHAGLVKRQFELRELLLLPASAILQIEATLLSHGNRVANAPLHRYKCTFPSTMLTLLLGRDYYFIFALCHWPPVV